MGVGVGWMKKKHGWTQQTAKYNTARTASNFCRKMINVQRIPFMGSLLVLYTFQAFFLNRTSKSFRQQKVQSLICISGKHQYRQNCSALDPYTYLLQYSIVWSAQPCFIGNIFTSSKTWLDVTIIHDHCEFTSTRTIPEYTRLQRDIATIKSQNTNLLQLIQSGSWLGWCTRWRLKMKEMLASLRHQSHWK